LLEQLKRAKESVIIVSPFIDEFGINLLQELINRGVRVVLVSSMRSIDEHIIAKLVKMGVELHLSNSFIHTKIYVIDSNKAFTSSANLTGPALLGRNIEHVCSCNPETALNMVNELINQCIKVDEETHILVDLLKDMSVEVRSFPKSRTGMIKVSECPVTMLVSEEPPGIAFAKNGKVLLVKRGVYAEAYRDIIAQGLCIATITSFRSRDKKAQQNIETRIYLADTYIRIEDLKKLDLETAKRRYPIYAVRYEESDPIVHLVVNHWALLSQNDERLQDIVEFFRWFYYIVLRHIFMLEIPKTFTSVANSIYQLTVGTSEEPQRFECVLRMFIKATQGELRAVIRVKPLKETVLNSVEGGLNDLRERLETLAKHLGLGLNMSYGSQR